MNSNKEDRLRDSIVPQTPRHDDGRNPRPGDERTRSRRLADVRRGNRSRHQLELLASAQGGKKHHSSTPSSWTSESRGLELWSEKEKREKTVPKPPDLETRHSCPALPAISSSLENYHDITDSADEICTNRLSASHDLNPCSKTKQLNKQESFKPYLPKEEQFLARAKSLDYIANSRHLRLKDAGLPMKNKTPNQLSSRTPSLFQNENKSKPMPNVVMNTNSKLPSETLGNSKEIENHVSTKHAEDGKLTETGPVVATRGRYSVLLNGGTLTTNAPYVDRIEGDTINTTATRSGSVRQPKDADIRQRKTTSDNSSGRDRGRRAQKSTTTAHRKLESVPSPSRRRGRHLRSHKELFAFQQDLLLPRYRKLAGINGNDVDETMKTEHEPEKPPGEEHQGDGRNNRRSDAREVFEKVRLIIKGPEKVETAPKPTEHKVRQMMPIYLKSGLPCGYVDSSSKCDAWLYSNDFDDL